MRLHPKDVVALSMLAAVTGTMIARNGMGFAHGTLVLLPFAFAFLAYLLRGVDIGGAIAGLFVAMVFLSAGGPQYFFLLLMIFMITFAATRAGRQQKARLGIAESTTGRNAGQVTANLLVATLLLAFSGALQARFTQALVLATLAELVADTVSSEVGEAFGGRPINIRTFNRTAPGANGGITLLGSLAGAVGAMAVVGAAYGLNILPVNATASIVVAAILAMFFDSLLGATLEDWGWIGNDTVNLLSTIAAAGCCAALIL